MPGAKPTIRTADCHVVIADAANGRSWHPRVVGAYVRKGWQVIAVARWGIGPMGSTHQEPYGTHEDPYGIAIRLRRVVAGIVRRAIAVI